MIREEKYYHALYALHQIFVRIRFMAGTQEPFSDIVTLSDYAEIMPEFIASEIDETEQFEGYLKSIAKTFPNLQGILEKFNSDENPYDYLKHKQ